MSDRADGTAEQTMEAARARRGAHGEAVKVGLKDQPRPPRPVVLKGGVQPHGKKSWLKGKTYRETEADDTADASVRATMEGVPSSLSRSAGSQASEQVLRMLAPHQRTAPRAKRAEYQPTPNRGVKARPIAPPDAVIKRMIIGATLDDVAARFNKR